MTITEEATERALKDAGFECYHAGWPDLIACKDGRLIAVEVKVDGVGVTLVQEAVHRMLRDAGVDVVTLVFPKLGYGYYRAGRAELKMAARSWTKRAAELLAEAGIK
jgi:hypothetical protein